MESYDHHHQQQLPLLSSWPQTNTTTVENSSSITLTATQNPKERRNGKRGPGIRLSTDPQSVAARQRRHRISDRFRILKSLVPGGSKLDTVSMLEEAINYVKFLKAQIWLHQAAMMDPPAAAPEGTTTLTLPSNNYYTNHSGGDQASVYPTNYYDDYCNLVPAVAHQLEMQQVGYYSLPPSPPPLTPLPYSSFQGGDQEIMPSNVSFSYYNQH